jgi:hypothetical protein
MKFYLPKNGWYLFIPLLLFFSCSQEDEKFFYSNFSDLDSLEIVMPDEYLQFTNWTTYKKNEQTILVEYGVYGNGDLIIHQVDFNTEAYLKTMRIPRDGPDGYNSSAASVFINNEDSVYVFPSARNFFFFYNADGKQVSQLQYNSSNFERYYQSGYYSSMVPLNDGMMLTTINDTRYDDPEYFSKVAPIQFFDQNSSQFVEKIDYPKFIRGKFVPGTTGATLSQIDKDQILINYSFSDSISIYNVETKVTTSLYCGADYFGKPKLLAKLPNKMQEIEYEVKEVDYELAFYHNSKVYRVVSHISAAKYGDYSIMDILNQNLRVFSLVEMDLKTGALKYYKMPIAKYFVFQGNSLFAGGVSAREKGQETYRRFYKYTLE